jgi:hypothetical protein
MSKLDLIIDALEMVLVSSECEKYYEALAAARELRALEPVAWKDRTYGNLHHQDWGKNIPLYALGESND